MLEVISSQAITLGADRMVPILATGHGAGEGYVAVLDGSSIFQLPGCPTSGLATAPPLSLTRAPPSAPPSPPSLLYMEDILPDGYKP